MEYFMKLALLGMAAFLMSTGAMANDNVSGCYSTRTIGSAQVSKPGFSRNIRALRAQCSRAANRYEAAQIVWNQSDRSYDCVVGSFCSDN